MANSQVAVTAGSGTNVDTFTQSSGDHRQALVIGDQDFAYTARVGAEGGLWTVPRGGVRTNVAIGYEGIATTASEALITPTFLTKNGTESAAAYAVATGTTFRVQAILASITLVGTTVANTRIRLRYNTAGAAAVGSPRALSWRIGNWSIGTQAAGYTQPSENLPFPDGLEFNSGTGLGLTLIASTATMMTVDLMITGYEYPNTPS